MHKLLFSLKRAHQSTLRFSRQMLDKKGLTPARYDLLHALKLRRENGISQRHMKTVLGVCRATVSRMLGSLEELGLVRREVNPFDRRCKHVWLTDEGFARFQGAYDPIVRRGWVQYAVNATLGTGGYPEGIVPKYCVKKMAELDGHLWALRRGFGDTGSLGYPR